MTRLSRGELRKTRKAAAEEFFSRRNRPPTQFRSRESAPEPEEPSQNSEGLPPPGTVLDIGQSKEILRRLASGELKQQRRR